MRTIYNRYQVLGADVTATLSLDIPAGAILRRVEVHLFTVGVSFPTADTATGLIDLVTLLESDSVDASTWLMGQEPIQARQPVSWQGKIHINPEFFAKIWMNVSGVQAGQQIELAAVIDS